MAAGIFKYGVHDLIESGTVGVLTDPAFDLTGVLPPDAWYTTLLSGIFNFTPQPSVLETIAWVVYIVPVLMLFIKPSSRRPGASSSPSTPAASASS